MSIETDLGRIATSLEAIAASLASGVAAGPATPDKPARKAPEKAAVVENPTLTNGDTRSSSADAASASAVEQPTAAAPVADMSPSATPDVTVVNAAVLRAVRPDALGKEATVATLQKYGGAKVPAIDASKHADLLADLTAQLAAKGIAL